MEGGEEETRKCSNCDKEIPAVTFGLHELHCARHLVKCSKCGEAVPRNSLQQHDDEEHKMVDCDLCQMQMEENQLEDHKRIECEQRPLQCSYCQLEYPYAQYADHEDVCGSRTDQCEKCGSTVMLRNMLKHESSKCASFTTEQQRPSHKADYSPLPRAALVLRSPGVLHSADRGYDHDLVSVMHPFSAQRGLLPKIHNSEANRADDRQGQPNSVLEAKKQKMLSSNPNAARKNPNSKYVNRPGKPPSSSTSSKGSSQNSNYPGQPVTRQKVTRARDKPRSTERSAVPAANPPSLLSERKPTNPQSRFQPKNYHSVKSTATKPKVAPSVKSRAPGPAAEPLDSDDDETPPATDVLETIANQDCIPCEFCGCQLPMDMLLRHQTDCAEGGMIDDYGGPVLQVDTRPVRDRITSFNNNSSWEEPYAGDSIAQYPPHDARPQFGQNIGSTDSGFANREDNNVTPPLYHVSDGDNDSIGDTTQHYRLPDVKPLSHDSDDFSPVGGLMRPISRSEGDLVEENVSRLPERNPRKLDQQFSPGRLSSGGVMIGLIGGRGFYAAKFEPIGHHSDEEQEDYGYCEHCEFPFTLKDLMRHELVCIKAPMNVMATHSSPARFTNSSSPSKHFPNEETTRAPLSPTAGDRFKNMALEDKNYGGRDPYNAEPVDDETPIPCEYCNKEFAADTLTQHEFVCQKNIRWSVTPYPGENLFDPTSPTYPSTSNSPEQPRTDDSERQRGLENYSFRRGRMDDK